MVVVDASVAYKWFSQEEPDFGAAFKIIEDHKLGKQRIIAPNFIVYELANAWATKTKLTIQRAKSNLRKLQDGNIELVTLEFPFVQKAMVLSKKYRVSVYDAIYVALAINKKCDFVTADSQLIDKIKLPFVKSLKDYV